MQIDESSLRKRLLTPKQIEAMNKTWTGDKELTIIIIEPIGIK
jgi:hypothetical protein